jgi:hypothetical protein
MNFQVSFRPSSMALVFAIGALAISLPAQCNPRDARRDSTSSRPSASSSAPILHSEVSTSPGPDPRTVDIRGRAEEAR